MSNRVIERFKEYINASRFNAIRLGIASPEKILSLSYGEVKKIETMNYRTLKPEPDGLFCPRIFGPVRDWECNCGKYKRMKHRGITCEKCGVEVIQSRVRRERMGHINLASPVCHIWFLKGIPSYLSIILDMTVKDLERVIYFDGYLVINQGSSPYEARKVLTNQEYNEYLQNDAKKPENERDLAFTAKMGAEAIRSCLTAIDLSFEVRKLLDDLQKSTSVTAKHRIARRYKLLRAMLRNNTRPEWIILQVLPVLPPDLRPLVPLEGGRFASSDLNDLYRRVLNRNIRLKRLIELDAPEVIIKNEMRILQEAVDALVDNGRRSQPVRVNRRPLKSLSELLRGKQGRFRQNLLGKRVDYSGRSVIVVDPNLKMHQCGLPKLMALELFKPYLYVELQRRELVPNVRAAKRMVEGMSNEVWEALEEVVKNRPILLNRAPTLHRLGIQAFFPILVEGKAIKIHPLVCTAFNADFDGDQMAVHIPLSKKSREEAIALMLSTNNILSPANGRPITVPSQDMVLGLYYLTKGRKNVKGEGLIFGSVDEVRSAHQHNSVTVHAHIKLRIENKIVDTTVGRVLLYEQLPATASFSWINKALTRKDLVALISKVYRICGKEATIMTLDNIKKLGFSYATYGGISLSLDNLVIPEQKKKIIEASTKEATLVEKLYRDGAITNGERYGKIIQIWARATEDVAEAMISQLEQDDKKACENADGSMSPFNSVFIMLDSGARGSRQQIRQLGGMRGLMAKPSGEIMETPVLSNFKEGLELFEYFTSTHGARKGQADTALKTADSGYLTRKLVDVAQDVIVTKEDCKSAGHVRLSDLQEAGTIIETLEDRSFGRVAACEVKDPVSGQVVVREGELITQEVIDRLQESFVTEVPVRSVLTCQASRGICALCYGMDLGSLQLVAVGTAVGIIAAQSIGEPGTQLTLKTFHVGGTASGVAEKSSLEARCDGRLRFTSMSTIKNRDGQTVVINRRARGAILSDDGRELDSFPLEYGSVLLMGDEQEIKQGQRIAQWDEFKVILTEKTGRAEFVDLVENSTYHESYDEETGMSSKIILERRDEKKQPCVAILDNETQEEIARYYLPTGTSLIVHHGQQVYSGDVIAKLHREGKKTKDITGGLTRVTELFEARTPRNPAILSEVDGQVHFGGLHRGQRRITVTTADGEVFEYNVPRSKHLNVEDGEIIRAGDPIASGVPNVHDILRILGPDELQKYLVKGIQEIYTLQGGAINDKHIEVIVRQMLRNVKIVDPGDTDFVTGDRVDKIKLQSINRMLAEEGKKPATSKPLLMGITKASFGTDSFIAAASFQETTRVLTEAAIMGQVDYLTCLKSNVTIGGLIPAGTGVPAFRRRYLGKEISEFEEKAQAEERLEIGLDSVILNMGT